MSEYFVVSRKTCGTCEGKGKILIRFSIPEKRETCGTCEGRGFLDSPASFEEALMEYLSRDTFREIIRTTIKER